MTRLLHSAAHRAGDGIKRAARRYVETMAYADPSGLGFVPLDAQPLYPVAETGPRRAR